MDDGPSAMDLDNQIIIGGIGGSGTRLVAKIVDQCGCYMGNKVNGSYDCSPLIPWFKKFEQDNIFCGYNKEMADSLKEYIIDYFREHTKEIFGWKMTSNIYFIKFFNETFKNCKFIHVIRDGRDMAYSKNSGQYILFRKQVLKEKYNFSKPLAKALMWKIVNLFASDYGKNNMDDRYLLIRYEDACLKFKETIEKIMQFTNCHNQKAFEIKIKPRLTIGRYRNHDTKEIMENIQSTLERFDY
jgi:hypothetical protein